MDGQQRLKNEAKELTDQIYQELKELLLAKEVAVKLHNLMNTYESVLRNKEASTLKIADEVTMKKILKEKLYKEIQGFRTSPADFKDLDMVSPSDIHNVIQQIKQKLG